MIIVEAQCFSNYCGRLGVSVIIVGGSSVLDLPLAHLMLYSSHGLTVPFMLSN